MLTRRGVVAGLSLASISAGAHRAAAQTSPTHQAYPTQTIRIIAGFPAGGGIDLVARLWPSHSRRWASR